MSGLTLISLALGLVPGLMWLWLYRQEDPHPEPRGLIVRTFIAGALVAFLALLIQSYVRGSILVENQLVLVLILTFVLAGIEEICKFFAAFFMVRYNADFDEPVDAMIYPIVASLGFATIENIAVAHGAGSGLSIAPVFQAISLRFIGATLLHSIASGLVGYSWGLSLVKRGRSWGVVGGLLLATVLHGIFNILILFYDNLAYSVFFVVGAGILVLFDFRTIKRLGNAIGV